MKPKKTAVANVNYAYFDYEIKAVNDARDIENGCEIVDGSLWEREDDVLYSYGPDADTMVVELEPFWLREGVNHFTKNLFEPLLDKIKDDFLNEELNFKRVKFIFPYRLKDAWHWNAAELIFSQDEDECWHVSGAKYDPYGVKKDLEDVIVRAASQKFSQKIFNSEEEILLDPSEEIKFASAQKGGVACGMYAAFMLHKLKTQDFSTQEELDDPQNGIWSGIAESEEEQRQEDLDLVDTYLPEKLEKFGKINEGEFIDSSRYLPSRIFKKDQDYALPDQAFEYLHNVISICQELDVQDLESLFKGNINSIQDRCVQTKKDDPQLAEKLDQISVYLMLSLEEIGQKNSQKFIEYLQSAVADIVQDKSSDPVNTSLSNKDLDPFSYQIHRHYSGILERLEAIDENLLGEKLKQISQVVNGLESDETVQENENDIRDRIANILKNKLLFRMAAKVFDEEYPYAQSDNFPELDRVRNVNVVDGETYIYDNKDYFSHCLQVMQARYLQGNEYVLALSASLFKGDQEIKDLLAKPNLSLWYDKLDHHLDLYGKEIIKIEENKIDQERQERDQILADEAEERNAREFQEEDDPDSIEHDYGDYEDSSSDSEQENESENESESETSSEEENFYLTHDQEFTNPSDFKNLIAISSNFGEAPLSWLTNQIAEYEQDELWDYMIEQIISDPQLADLDSDLLKFIVHQASAFNGEIKDGADESMYHLCNSGSLARDYDDEKLVSGGFVTDAFAKYLSEINRKKLSEDVGNEFAYVKEVSDKGWLRELQKSYNEAHGNNDLVTQNQVWSIFDLLQKNLKTLKFDEQENPAKLLKSLEKAKKEYQDRADQYYFRIYPQPETDRLVYSSKKEEKVAVIEMDKILGELEEVGHKIENILKEKTSAKEKDTTNVVVPVLCFVVSNRPHKDKKSQRDHGRVIIPISCDFDVPEYLLSKNQADGVVAKTDADFFKTAKSDSKYGMEKVKKKAILAKQDPEPTSQNNELLSHSERTMFEAFRKEANVGKIVKILHDELRKIYPDQLDKKDRFKVYSVALLAYSSNSVCQLCSPAIIAHENYTQDSFLTLLTKNLRNFSNKIDGQNVGFFKLRGDSEPTEIKPKKAKAVNDEIPETIKQKFHLTTVITSTKPFTKQSEDMCGVGKKKEHQNPQSRIYLEKNAIDLHQQEKDKDGKPIQDHYSFYEFSQSNFKKSLEKQSGKSSKKEAEPKGFDFQFVGKAFMSGDKTKKLSGTKIKELNSEVKTVIKGREAIRLKDLDKAKFVSLTP